MTLKLDGWHWKTIGHMFYAISSFVHHFVAIGEFKLNLQSGNAQFGSKWAFFTCVALKFDGWPWKSIGLFFYATLSFVHHYVAIGEFKLKLQSGNAQFGSKWAFFTCDLEIWRMTLKVYRALLLCYFKLCASFHNHRRIQTRVTVRKYTIWVKIGYFLPQVTLKFNGWHWKTIEHIF